jgi:hypothetical protein
MQVIGPELGIVEPFLGRKSENSLCGSADRLVPPGGQDSFPKYAAVAGEQGVVTLRGYLSASVFPRHTGKTSFPIAAIELMFKKRSPNPLSRKSFAKNT